MFSGQGFDDIKVDAKIANQAIERDKLLKMLKGNKEALNMLSVDRLRKLEEYYNNIIEQNNEKIRKLKTSM